LLGIFPDIYMNAPVSTGSTREQIVAHAQTLIRQRGYNGFSYRDLAEHVGVKTASIHYYFPQKDDLLIEALNDYSSRTMQLINGIDESLPAAARLDRYAQMLAGGPRDQVCMCGMLAADFASVSDRVRAALQAFFRVHETWLTKVLTDGARDGSLKPCVDPQAEARTLFASFQGALLASRLFQTPERIFDVVAGIESRQAATAAR